MGEECEILEVLKKERERSGDLELSLELSIGGGKYGKSENSRIKTRETVEGPNNNINNNYSNNFGMSRSVSSCDLQRRKGIQALRRQEARKKREEKLKKSRKVGFFEDNNKFLLFEAQRLEARVGDRGTRENDGFLEEEIRKNDKNGASETANDDLSLSLFTESKSQQIEIKDCLLYPKVQHLAHWNYGFDIPCGVSPSAGAGETLSNRSLEQSSSAVSDYQMTSHKGRSNSDTGSQSSPSPLNKYNNISRNEFNPHFESNDSSCQTEPDRRLGGSGPAKLALPGHPHSSLGPFSDKLKVVTTDTHFDQTNNNACSTSYNVSRTSDGGLHGKPVVHMPCVSTTGNGPNGRTVRGFLYTYTKTEVSIVCVCHGISFSPAEFVEHAGGVDILHPLRHITVVGSAFE